MSKQKQKLRAKTPKRPSKGMLEKIASTETKRSAKSPGLTRKRTESPRSGLQTFLVRMAPIWALLLMAVILVGWNLPRILPGLLPRPSTNEAYEPIYRIEGGGGSLPSTALPPPNWLLEISPIFTPEVQHWEQQIGEWSLTYRIKPNMIATIMQIESCGNPDAFSDTGASGLFQVMSVHFDPSEDAYDAQTNALRALTFLGELLLQANGDAGLTFAAYNGGPSVLNMSPAEWPQETKDYQYWASGIYEDAETGISEGPTLEAWLEAGGASLCAEAAAVLGLTQ